MGTSSTAAPSTPSVQLTIFTPINNLPQDSTPQSAIEPASTSRLLRQIRAFTYFPVEVIDLDNELDIVQKRWPRLADDEELVTVKRIAISIIEQDGKRLDNTIVHKWLRILKEVLGIKTVKLKGDEYKEWEEQEEQVQSF